MQYPIKTEKIIAKQKAVELQYKLNKLTPSDYYNTQRKRYSLFNDKIECSVEIKYAIKDEYENSNRIRIYKK